MFPICFWLLTGAAPMVNDPQFQIRMLNPATALTREQLWKLLEEDEKELRSIPLPKLPMKPVKPAKP